MATRTTLTMILVFLHLSVFGQTAQDYLITGLEKHRERNFKAAIKNYDKAIKLDNSLKEAYFNRGVCALTLKDYKLAVSDFTRTIDLDAAFVEAFYYRATAYVTQKKYTEALRDLDRVIELDETLPNALLLRGQIRGQTGDREGSCKDFSKAKEQGDEQADGYYTFFCEKELQQRESMLLDWSKVGNWIIGHKQENEVLSLTELIHAGETLESWTEIGTMISMKGIKHKSMDGAMNWLFSSVKQNSPTARLTLVEKDETAEYPWIIFAIEDHRTTDKKSPGYGKWTESQLWHMVQGKASLYSNSIAIKQSSISAEHKDKWSNFFKTGKVVYKGESE